MYLVGKGHEHLGPGTSMVQRIAWDEANEAQLVESGGGNTGLGEVGCVPEFYQDCTQMKGTCNDFAGLGCTAGMGCGCKSGMGGGCTTRGSCGMGIFDSGMDVSTWGIAEWAVVAIGGYMLLSTVSQTKRAARAVSGAARGAIKGARRGNPGRRRR